MKKKTERILWISVCSLLVFVIAGLIVIPKAIAQERDPESEQYLKQLEQVFYFVQENYVEEVPPEQLFKGALKGLFKSLDDPYSVYLSEEDMRDMSDTTQGQFGGVGIYISKPSPERNAETKANGDLPYVEVVSPIEDTPAYKAGITSGDYIIKIEGESTEPLTIDDVVKKLRGKPGEPVTVTILRGKNVTFDVTLERAIIEIPTVKQATIPYKGETYSYLRIIQFTRYTDERVQEALDSLETSSKKCKGLIIDVRSNPGGLLSSVVDTADFFLSGGTIVSTQGRVKRENQIFRAHAETALPGEKPIAVLINQGSASASEILAGALKDRGRAVLIGETSYGKGSVQQIFQSFGDSGFKLTMARYYTPDGVNIDKVGIDPNISVDLPEMDEEDLEDLQTLMDNKRIEEYVDRNSQPSEEEITRFIQELRNSGITMERVFLHKLIIQEVNRRMDDPPVYNLEQDLILQRALQHFEENHGKL